MITPDVKQLLTEEWWVGLSFSISGNFIPSSEVGTGYYGDKRLDWVDSYCDAA